MDSLNKKEIVKYSCFRLVIKLQVYVAQNIFYAGL